MFYHPITEFVFKEFLWEAKTQLDDIAHDHTITVFVGSYLQETVMGSRPMKRKKKIHRVIIIVHCSIVIVVNQSNYVMHYFDPYSSFSR